MTMKYGMQHRVLEYYQVCSNDDLGLTLTYLTTRSNSVHYAFVWENGKTMDFSETIIIYDIKVGRCSQPNEYIKLYEYQWSRSFFDLGPRSIRFNIFKLLFLRNRQEAKYHVEPLRDRGIKVSTNGLCHMIMTKIAAMSIYGKNL